MIDTKIRNLRDPFILADGGNYYAYGTGVIHDGNWNQTIWACYKNESGRLDGEWKMTENLVYELPEYAEKQRWAAEVHKYKGNFYMIASYFSSQTQHRGCSILKSSSPEGPFVEITNGHVTPHDYDSIDGTLYIDEDGQPWLVFVHEWTCTDDGCGRMSVAKLSDDLTHFISEPIDLFRADDPSWTNYTVTDGCFMYKTKDGQLLMIWSNFKENENGANGDYSVAIARSKNGKVDGEWIHDDELLFTRNTVDQYDGGHGMIFTDKDGQMYLVLHSPNNEPEKSPERTILVPIHEENGTLVCDAQA